MNATGHTDAPLEHSEFRRGWPVVLSSMLGIALGLSPMPFYTIGIFAPIYAREFHWSFAQVFGGITCTTFAVILASPGVGIAADRYGVRPVALVSVALFGVSFMAFAFSNGSLPLFYATWLTLAFLGAGTLPITWTRAVNNGFQRSKGLALGLSLLGTGLFGYIIKPLAAWLIVHFGWRGALVAIGALPLLISLPIGLLFFHDPGNSAIDPMQRRIQLQELASTTPGLTFRQTLRQWRFWLLGACFVALAFAVGGLVANMENILRVKAVAPADIVPLTSMIGLSVIFGRILGGWLMDRFWAPGIAALVLGAPAAGCLVLNATELHYWSAFAAIGLIGFAAGAEYDLLAFMVARYFGMKSYGSVYGALYSFYALGAGVGPAFFGADFDRTHSYRFSLYLASGLFIGGAVLLLLLGPYRRFESGPRLVNPGRGSGSA